MRGENFKQEYARLNSAQRLAVDTIDGPVLVVAGPGTGKTQLLGMRVANILQKTDVNPNNILCLTYTESGKEAIQSRLADLLGGQAKKVEVHTFHSFGNYLFTRFSDYFPQLAGFRQADDLALYEMLFSCFEQLPRSNPLSKMAYGQFTYLKHAASRISQLKQAGISPEEALQKAQADTDWCKTVGRKITNVFNDAGRLSPKVASGLTAQLEPLLNSEHTTGLSGVCLNELKETLQNGVDSGKTAGLSAYKKKWFASEEGKLYFKPADQLKKLAALAELYALYEAELTKRKLYDYDDMLLKSLQKMQTSYELLAQVQETFQYILADEYQDTNAAQASIITLIADNPVNEHRPNVMVVGDDDQAIYGFQGALGDVLLAFRELWRDVKVITLKDNYRSTQTLIDTARHVITLGQNRLENYYQDIDKSLTGKAPYPAIKPTVFQAGSHSTALAKAVALAKSHAQAGDGQLAIIAKKHKYLRELADQLDAAKVSYYYEYKEDLLKEPAVANALLIATVANAIKQGKPEQANYVLPELFANGLLKISRLSAWQIAVNARLKNLSWWQSMQNLHQPDIDKAAQALKLTAATIDTNDTLESLRAVAKQYDLKITRKVKYLVGHAAKYYGRDNFSLSELINYTNQCTQAGITLSSKTAKGNFEANVVLLSAHKSKGLEFDRVYVLHADYYTWFKELGRRNILTLPEGWNYIEPAAETNDDKLRLLYVVMTRAKKELGLIQSRAMHSGKQAEVLPGLESLEVQEYTSEQANNIDTIEEQIWQSWYLPANQREQAELKKLLKPVLNNYRLSPTHLTRFLDIAHGGPTTFLTDFLLSIPQPKHPEAIFGNHVHAALRFAQNQLNKTGAVPDTEDLKTYIKESSANMSDAQVLDVVDVVVEFLSHTAILQPGAAAEYSFSNQNLQLQELHLTGNVDHYLQKDSELTITDFKTGRAVNSWRVTEDYYKQKLHRFRQQLLFYELLFKLSPDFTDIKSVTSKVAFVEPSRRDVYYELTLDADEKERTNLEPLMKAVWQKITNLDLPNTSQYPQTFEGVETFEDDLLTGNI